MPTYVLAWPWVAGLGTGHLGSKYPAEYGIIYEFCSLSVGIIIIITREPESSTRVEYFSRCTGIVIFASLGARAVCTRGQNYIYQIADCAPERQRGRL